MLWFETPPLHIYTTVYVFKSGHIVFWTVLPQTQDAEEIEIINILSTLMEMSVKD